MYMSDTDAFFMIIGGFIVLMWAVLVIYYLDKIKFELELINKKK